MTEDSGKIPYLPERIADLERIALNLWWRWDRRARWMLRAVDPVIWSATRHNPVALLRQVSPGRLAECASDPEFLKLYDRTLAAFDETLRTGDTWFSRYFPDVSLDNPVAYFCAEFGLHNSIPIYSGGLGVLAGDHCKAASDLGVPLIGVGLLYSKGYFDQKLNLDGWQEDSDEVFDPEIMPLVRLTGPSGSLSLASVETSGRIIHVGAWLLEAGRIKLYLLDTNLPENDPEDRELTYKLYGGEHEHRLKQEWILGIGGVRVLRALGIRPGAWHANEGHASFMMVERLRARLEAGESKEDAIRNVRAHSVFTTHTPVPAGHDMFPPESVDAVCSAYWEEGPMDRDSFYALGAHPDLDRGSLPHDRRGDPAVRQRQRRLQAPRAGDPGAVEVLLARTRPGPPPDRRASRTGCTYRAGCPITTWCFSTASSGKSGRRGSTVRAPGTGSTSWTTPWSGTSTST